MLNLRVYQDVLIRGVFDTFLTIVSGQTFRGTGNIVSLQLGHSHIPGALDPKPHTDYQCFIRVEEVALGVSLNTQSQVPDINGISSRVVISLYTLNFFTDPIQDPGHSLAVVVLVFGRTLGFFQLPRSSR